MKTYFQNRLSKNFGRIAAALNTEPATLSSLYDSGYLVAEFSPNEVDLGLGENRAHWNQSRELWGVIDRWYGVGALGGLWPWSTFKAWMMEGATNVSLQPVFEAEVSSVEELADVLHDIARR